MNIDALKAEIIKQLMHPHDGSIHGIKTKEKTIGEVIDYLATRGLLVDYRSTCRGLGEVFYQRMIANEIDAGSEPCPDCRSAPTVTIPASEFGRVKDALKFMMKSKKISKKSTPKRAGILMRFSSSFRAPHCFGLSFCRA